MFPRISRMFPIFSRRLTGGCPAFDRVWEFRGVPSGVKSARTRRGRRRPSRLELACGKRGKRGVKTPRLGPALSKFNLTSRYPSFFNFSTIFLALLSSLAVARTFIHGPTKYPGFGDAITLGSYFNFLKFGTCVRVVSVANIGRK